MNNSVYLHGKFQKESEASISPFDRGYLFADGVYEVIKYYKGVPFRMNDHMERLARSLKELDIQYGDLHQLPDIFQQLIERNGQSNDEAGVYVQITRGSHQRMHHFPAGISPTIFAYSFPLPSDSVKLQQGIKVITMEDIRWHRCDIKSVSLLPNTMLYNRAKEAGAGECILYRDRNITEATHSSVLAVKNQQVITKPLSNLILPGITRKVVLEICANHDIDMIERDYSLEELYDMDECFIAGTGSEITPVVQVDNQPVGNKKPGEVTRLLQKLFFELTVA